MQRLKRLTGSINVDALGEARAGNPVRAGERTNPTVGCLKNYYSKVWVANLGSGEWLKLRRWETNILEMCKFCRFIDTIAVNRRSIQVNGGKH